MIINDYNILIRDYNKMNEKQLDAFNVVKNNQNLFLSGSAGTGKSFTIKKIVEYLEHNNINYGLTALTGCAASLINGQTLHSYLLLGIDKSLKDIYNDLSKKYIPKLKSLKSLNTLIIDEISMMSNELIELIDELFKLIKSNLLPFGGIQVILVGDFHQLPPIKGNYCFTSPTWDALNMHNIILTDLIRQKDDLVLQEILEELRNGKISDETFEILKSLNKTEFLGDVKPTKLFPVNTNVDKINNKEFQKLVKINDGNITIYKAFSNYKVDNIDTFNVCLTLNAQIMVIRNISIENHLVNGTRGVVVGLLDKCVIIKDINNNIHHINYYTDLNKNKKNNISFMPLKLAYAISIHKSQGSSIDCLELDLGDDIFVSGQTYTALSRATNINNIKIINIEKNSFFVNKKIIEFYKK
jgi:ATP-dependent exoDNAse (exonuclease V) alpha subunit